MQVTERYESDKMMHYNQNHQQHLFRCRLCQGQFASATRFGVFAHLRKIHRKDESDEDLTRRHMILPMDIRRLYCTICAEKEGGDSEAQWCCQKLRDLEEPITEHRDKYVIDLGRSSENCCSLISSFSETPIFIIFITLFFSPLL